MIVDSGNRQEFPSGAVRDMRAGKGRCDLVPLDVLTKLMDCYEHDTVLPYLALYAEEKTTHNLYGALIEFAHLAFQDSVETMVLEVAKHFEDGCEKYGEDNWRKGVPEWCYLDSAIRHYLKWRRGDNDERHDRAFVWNLMCCCWEVDYHHD